MCCCAVRCSLLAFALAAASKLPDGDYEDDNVTSSPPNAIDKDHYLTLLEPMNNLTTSLGQEATLHCRVSGHPAPTFRWLKNDAPVQQEPGRLSVRRTTGGSRLRIRNLHTTDTGYFQCIASSSGHSISTTGVLYVKFGPPPTVNSGRGAHGAGTAGFCQPYRGIACARFIGNRSIYVDSLEMQGKLENHITAAFTMMGTSNHLSDRCSQYAIPSLCLYAFPPCVLVGFGSPAPQRLCRDECDILENDLCRTEFVLARSNPSLLLRLRLPDCGALPVAPDPQESTCVRVGIPLAELINRGHNCFNETGIAYRGTASVTRSGRQCQPWNSQYPHAHSLTAGTHRELAGGHAYCRNPGGKHSEPWCFTLDEGMRSELCDIPACEQGPSSHSSVLYILIPSVAIPLVVALLFLWVCLFRNHRKPPSTASAPPVHPPAKPTQSQAVEMAQLGAYRPQAKVKEVRLASVRLLEELGEGALGKVYRGHYYPPGGHDPPLLIAVKTLRDGLTTHHRADFQQEVSLLAELRHPNLAGLVAVAPFDQPLSALYEYTSHGDLREFLIRRSPCSDVAAGPAGERDGRDGRPPLELADFLFLAAQVAAGMEYLSSHGVIHKDLAARNVLIGDRLHAKVSVLGVRRDVYASDYYRISPGSPALPVRWLSPEALHLGKLTAESDTWAYGVLLWELFSFGLQPYLGLSNAEVCEAVRARQLLPCPDDCPPRVYALMLECWQEPPARRPRYRELHARVRACEGISSHTSSNTTPSGGTAFAYPAYPMAPIARISHAVPAKSRSHSSASGSTSTGHVTTGPSSGSGQDANTPLLAQQVGPGPVASIPIASTSAGNEGSAQIALLSGAECGLHVEL
uniref:receptor protein-tyrosine kinase n=1 Tax=Eptatretus burgeri TaxID=7764 RepID=A0A8C4QQU9_EPTBU